MRPIEALLLFATGLLLAQPTTPFAIAVGLTLALHLAEEGSRWQMWPSYFTAALSVLLVSTSLMHWAVAVFVCAPLMIVSAVLAVVLPVFGLPALSGPYKDLGTRPWVLLDESRHAGYDEPESERRETMAQMWYPGVAPEAKTWTPHEPYMPFAGAFGPRQVKVFSGQLPSFLLNHLALVSTRSVLNAKPMDPETFVRRPLVIFSHGYSGSRAQNTAMYEELASMGIRVVALDHAHDAAAVVLPSGKIKEFKAAPPNYSSGIDMAWLRKFRTEQLRIRAADIEFLLARLKEDGLIVDATPIGVFGMSFGGATALMVASRNEQIRACATLDAWMWPWPEVERRVRCPTLMLQAPSFFSEDTEFSMHNRADVEELRASHPTQVVVRTVAGTVHHDFSDIALYAPLLTPRIGLSGSANGREVHAYLTASVRNFFLHHLRR